VKEQTIYLVYTLVHLRMIFADRKKADAFAKSINGHVVAWDMVL